MRWKKPLYNGSIILLLFTSFLSIAYADWEVDDRWKIDDRWEIANQIVGANPTLSTEVVLKISYNDVEFGIDDKIYFGQGIDFYLHKIEVNDTHLWIDKTYSFKHYTRYCLYDVSLGNSQFTINTWFPTANSTAKIRINHPTATNINLYFTSPNLISASASGVVSYMWDSATKILSMTVNSNTNPVFTITATVTETEHNITPENYAVEITDMEGCGNWVFSEEQYYTFQAKYWDGDGYADLDTMKIKFTDGIEDVIAVYNQPDEEWSLESGSEVVNLKAGTKTVLDSNLLQVTFEIYFKNTITDALDVDIEMWCNDTSGEEDDWEIKEADYFNIYNLGGASTLETSGTARRLTGGDVFELQTSNSSWADSYLVFRNLQHFKVMVKVTIDPDSSPEWEWASGIYSIKYYVDYCTTDDEWITGWALNLTLGDLNNRNPYGTYMFWNWTANWYNRDLLVKSEDFWTYWAYTLNGSDSKISNQMWIDLWFNKENASSVIGGRVNAYYFPMTDTSNVWLRWLTGSNWGPYEELRKQSMFFDTLKDENGETLHTQQIKLVKIGARVQITDSNYTQELTISDYDVFDLTTSPTTIVFQGIQTPVFDETRVPLMPQGGFLGAIVSALNQLGGWISNALGPALLGFWNSFVGFLDTVFTFTGNPTLFSDMMSWLSSLGGWLGDSFTWLISALTSVFTLLTAFLGKLLNTISTIVNQWVSVFQTFFAMLDGTYTAGVNLWNDLGLSTWIILVAILYPIYLIWIWDEKGIDGVLSHLKMVMDIAAWGITIFIRVIQLFLDVIGRIIESIPVVE